MVPADDEHKSANEPEKNTSRQKNFVEKLKFWKRDKKEKEEEEEEPAQLTPMPAWLMHWWTPLAIAGTLFLLSMLITSIWGTATYEEIVNAIQHFPKRWPFHMRTPSREEIEVCLTITGAGLAFSAWQQRSHDHATRELERSTDAQREEFWRRRESAHTLLNANSYAHQLEAIIRYLEMSDQIVKFNHIFTNASTYHQEAILTTLCAHMRKLGEAEKITLSELERAHLQEVIVKEILQRINGGPWNGLRVDLSETHFLSELTIKNLNTESIIYLNKSTFDHKVSIKAPSKITVYWEDAEFLGTLAISGTSSIDEPTKSIIHHDDLGTLPWFHNMPVIETSNEHGQQINCRYFENCYFIRQKDHVYTSNTLTLLYLSKTTRQSHSICKTYLPEHYSWATINFQDRSRAATHNGTTEYYLQGCQFGAIQATLGRISSRIFLKQCLFSNSHNILFTSTFGPHFQHNGESNGIHIIDCTITSTELTGDTLPPIKALYKGFTPHPPLIHFTTESRIICNEDQAPTIYRLTAEPLNARGNSILHATKIDDDNRTGKTPTFSWEYTCMV